MSQVLRLAVALCSIVLFGFGPIGSSPAVAQSATPAATCPATTEAENRAIVQRWYDALDAHDIAAFDTVFAPVVIQHAADFPDATGVNEIETNFAPFLAAFPDLRDRIDQWLTDGDFVVVRGEGSGTQQGPFMGIPPTGKKATWEILTIYRIECGKIAEQWSEVDALGRLVQLGAVALPATAPGATPAPAMASPAEAAAFAPASPAASPAACRATTAEENVALVRRWYDEVNSRGDFTHFDDFVTADHVHHRTINQVTTGAAAKEASLRAWRTAMPDLSVTPGFLLTDGDLVAAQWTASGTQTGPFPELPTTGKPVTWTGNTIFRIECGKIAEEWSEADRLSFFQQLGVLAWPAATPAASPAAA